MRPSLLGTPGAWLHSALSCIGWLLLAQPVAAGTLSSDQLFISPLSSVLIFIFMLVCLEYGSRFFLRMQQPPSLDWKVLDHFTGNLFDVEARRRQLPDNLGLRGVRLSLAREDLFEAQLRAIVRASGYGPVRILVPMVSSREEIVAVRALLKRVLREVRREGHPVAEQIPLGAMIEVPAAAIALPGFIAAVDFLSIGTNDLVQYLLAADRNNEALGELYSPLHPALLRLLHSVIRTARARGKPAAVCGEMAGDPALVPLLLALGLEEFSLHPATLLEVRRAVRDCDLTALRATAPTLLRARDRAAIERWLGTAYG